LADLIEQAEYIARDSPSYAASLVNRAERAATSLSEFPNRGRNVGEYRDPRVRELIVGSFRLIYRVGSGVVTIIAFVHTSRDLTRLIDGLVE
jgi:plasmid stabilization system protein ParE